MHFGAEIGLSANDCIADVRRGQLFLATFSVLRPTVYPASNAAIEQPGRYQQAKPNPRRLTRAQGKRTTMRSRVVCFRSFDRKGHPGLYINLAGGLDHLPS